MGFPRPHILASYLFLPENYFETVIGLATWCEEQIKQLEANGIVGLKRVGLAIGPWVQQDKPPSMIDEQELLRQLAALQEFRDKHDALSSK